MWYRNFLELNKITLPHSVSLPFPLPPAVCLESPRQIPRRHSRCLFQRLTLLASFSSGFSGTLERSNWEAFVGCLQASRAFIFALASLSTTTLVCTAARKTCSLSSQGSQTKIFFFLHFNGIGWYSRERLALSQIRDETSDRVTVAKNRLNYWTIRFSRASRRIKTLNHKHCCELRAL